MENPSIEPMDEPLIRTGNGSSVEGTPRSLCIVQRGTSADGPQGPVDARTLLDPAFPYGEDLLQFIWEQRLFEGHGLRTTDGRDVVVNKPGRIQRDSGPDLLGAEVRIDGQLWAGTVEVHLRSSDWDRHGHQFDPAYDNVILHVVYEHDLDVRSSNGSNPPTVELLTRTPMDRIALFLDLMRNKGFVPCHAFVDQVGRDRWVAWLDLVLVERLERKTEAVERLFHRLDGDPTATLYHMLAGAFGLKVNADPFFMLAQALPLRILQKYRTDAVRTEALLFGQAGLLQVDLVDDHPRALQQEYAALARLHDLRPMPMAAWKFGRMRPVNFPTVRIAQLAQLIIRANGDLSQFLAQDRVEDLHTLFDVEAGAYWSTHYTFDRPSHARPKRLGRTGADHLIINAVVPTLFALGRLLGRPAYGDRALQLLKQLPAEQNDLLRGWQALGVVADHAAHGQALLELKGSYCAQRACLTCGVGNQLLRQGVSLPRGR